MRINYFASSYSSERNIWQNSHIYANVFNMCGTEFEWDEAKNLDNQKKHGVTFEEAQYAFLDDRRLIAEDISHSEDEPRHYCFGMDRKQEGILTVRFTYREHRIRIIGAGYWRKGKKIYEQANSIH